MRNFADWRRRRRGAEAVLAKSPWIGFISKTTGYGLLNADTIPGTAEVVALCQKVVEDKGGLQSQQLAKKPFFSNILTVKDLGRYPQLLDFALSRPIIEATTDYLGMVPQFRAIGLYISHVNDSTQSSQLFHFDGDDLKQVKCFINVLDVEEGAGPLTILPADKSRELTKRLGWRWGDGRIADGDVFKYFSENDLIRFTGPAGAGGMVDTVNCLHYGSRARTGSRLVLMFQYTTFPNIKMDKGKFYKKGMPLLDFPVERFKDDPLKAAVL
ncbi:MAG: hypothetical protein L0Z68_04875 [Gammaproteobacteria bacterium]|nr:hypothetical protein [Gammaproteobacteria bacterium]